MSGFPHCEPITTMYPNRDGIKAGFLEAVLALNIPLDSLKQISTNARTERRGKVRQGKSEGLRDGPLLRIALPR